MRVWVALGMVASLACISAAEAPWQWQTYHGVRVDSDPMLTARFDRALRYCEPEAYRRGSSNPNSLLYVTALRSCMSRLNIIDRGSYSYVANNYFYHFLDR
ncbi:hypothetical protein [Rhizobium sp. Root1220]|uniref:hypothetical protein n=1 Tax=Rhizobium sp. Root1220 TaxID=1736432 RepID=UPI0006F94FFA|nr:hypothetical protein [Rhizobium sp. Root1220]KQV65382.1 hypothetical protein ASC90_15785 [Rhizobium sp. Root1220]